MSRIDRAPVSDGEHVGWSRRHDDIYRISPHDFALGSDAAFVGIRPRGRSMPQVRHAGQRSRPRPRRETHLLVQRMSAIEVLTWVAIAVGAAASAAALWGHYGVLPGWLTGPEICKLEHGGCAVLFRMPRAALLGVPNALLGILLYVLLALGILYGWQPWLLVVMVLPAVAMSTFLGWSLWSRSLQCRICWAGHVANFALLVLLAVRA